MVSEIESDELIDELLKMQQDELDVSYEQTLGGRIGEKFVILNNYLKHDGGKSNKPTGKAMLGNEVFNLAVIDVDIKKEYSDEMKKEVRDDVLARLSEDDIIVKTANGGLHIYCNLDYFYTPTNREIKCYKCDDFDIDLLACVDKSKRSLVTMAGSKVRNNAREPVRSYEFIRGSYESRVIRNVNEVLADLHIKLQFEQPAEIQTIMNKHKEYNDLSDELIHAVIKGLKDVEIHCDGGSAKLEKEVSLFTLFPAINSLPDDDLIEEAYNFIYQNSKLTANAREKFDFCRERYSGMSTNPYILIKIVRLWNNEYYKVNVKPLLPTRDFEIFKIDLKDNFTMKDVIVKAEKRKYKRLEDVVTDLSKVMRQINGKDIVFVEKMFSTESKRLEIQFVSDESMCKKLRRIILGYDGKKAITAYDALVKYQSKISKDGVLFNSDLENILSIFDGYKYKVLDDCNLNVINDFLTLIKEVIADGDDLIYNWILNWMLYVIQNPGKKTEAAIVLKGLQGTGKGTFTNVLCELLAGYSCKNITDISQLTGKFNTMIENKMLLVCNELRNCGDDRLANFDTLKTLITDYPIVYNEKCIPMRKGENVANFIFVTNNPYPVKIETGDRRYLVLHVNGKHKGDLAYFKALYNKFTDEFYDNLMTFFVKRDISEFNPRDIPMTEAKEDLIEASRSPMDQWINDHYDELVNGLSCEAAMISKPEMLKDKNFQLQIKGVCNKVRIQKNGVRKWYYRIKDECKALYHQTINDDEVEVDEVV